MLKFRKNRVCGPGGVNIPTNKQTDKQTYTQTNHQLYIIRFADLILDKRNISHLVLKFHKNRVCGPRGVKIQTNIQTNIHTDKPSALYYMI